MGLPLSQTPFDADAYLAWEAGQVEKSEYVAGEVFAMVGVRRVHATVALNIGAALREHLRGSPCLPFIADMKLRVASADAFFYPDVMVTCDERDRRADLFVEQPQLIVEVLSDSTAAYDRGAKFVAYRQIAALKSMCSSTLTPDALKCSAASRVTNGCCTTTPANPPVTSNPFS